VVGAAHVHRENDGLLSAREQRERAFSMASTQAAPARRPSEDSPSPAVSGALSLHKLQPPRKLSVVVPCYNEAAGLREFVRRLTKACEQCAGDDYELILVNDGSTDATWSEILRLAAQQQGIVGVDLAHNHGHQLALSAGLFVAGGDRILIIDADLQDPPELLSEMMARLDSGADVAYGQRVSRDGESWFKKMSAALFYRLLRRLADAPIPADTGDFRLMTRQVVDVLLAMPEQHRFIRGMVAWIGFRQVPVRYQRDARFAGTTKYPFGKMLRFAVDAITGFSAAPLRLSLYFSFGSVLLAFLVGLYAVWHYFKGDAVPGWTSIAITVLAFGSMQMFCLGIIGEYLGRIYTESKRRPLFVIRSIHQHEQDADAAEAGHDLVRGG
jgi:polyisoprenyl-phosphate glycosyltransferase